MIIISLVEYAALLKFVGAECEVSYKIKFHVLDRFCRILTQFPDRREWATKVDRVAFPAALCLYLTFCLVYWILLLAY